MCTVAIIIFIYALTTISIYSKLKYRITFKLCHQSVIAMATILIVDHNNDAKTDKTEYCL